MIFGSTSSVLQPFGIYRRAEEEWGFTGQGLGGLLSGFIRRPIKVADLRFLVLGGDWTSYRGLKNGKEYPSMVQLFLSTVTNLLRKPPLCMQAHEGPCTA